jgi:hypothetical protein
LLLLLLLLAALLQASGKQLRCDCSAEADLGRTDKAKPSHSSC